MVLAIGTLVVASIMVFYQSASMNSRTNETLNQISTINSTIRKVYTTAPNFATLNNNNIIRSNALPSKMVNGTRIIHAFSSDVILAPTSHNGGVSNSYFLTLNNIPPEACSKIILSDMGRILVGVRVNTTDIAMPVRPSDVSRCGNSPSSIRLQFF